ncbi:hypothetical protein PV10_06038 [Exophiala mesophila]|uniref:Conserved oligomeric Golgi complex subunit 1 n=1 Tax=Exophiala mesophila TaxID=212818 RepID=A0A0D1XTQ0_EXOME|nr:uncharacterized protein PV10_06038 [Exophiala mesophila]KIV91506.1 hypothetical protein PV10_06038 [Exophiala mesophila]
MDPVTTITSWEQAFESHRIPETRAIEKQLRTSATRDKEKLRSLVGGSYRDLLATADLIVALDKRTRTAEDHLSSISHACRPPEQDASPSSPSADKVILAQLQLLQRCATTSTVLLRQRKVLQCARLLVISRLLVKSVGDQEVASKPLEFLRNKIGHIRRQLLRQVDATLISPHSQPPDLLEALSSYSLVTNASSADALAHLFQLRLEKLQRHLDSTSNSTAVVGEGLRYQVASLQTFKSLIGRPLTEAVANLQKRPILAEPVFRDMESLNLDRLWVLIPSDIQSFVPYFKRTVLSPDEIKAKLEAWSRDACAALTRALEKHLSNLRDVDRVLELRKELYFILLPLYFSTPARNEIQHQIKTALNGRLDSLLRSQVSQLDTIVTKLLNAGNTKTRYNSLWDSELAHSGVNSSGGRFVQQVKAHHSGYHEALVKASRSLNKWITSIKATEGLFEQLSRVRWRDMVEEPDEEDEEEAIQIIKDLSQTDSDGYKETLKSSLHTALETYESTVTKAATEPEKANTETEGVTMLLRSIRMTSSALQEGFSGSTNFSSMGKVVVKLHETLAAETIKKLAASNEEAGKKPGQTVTSLPENMPSPRAFLVLQKLCEIMFDIGGTDIWSRPAVSRVKDHCRARIFAAEHRSWYMENAFDEAYLLQALKTTSSSDEKPNADALLHEKAAAEYWTRTKLLFGPLA